MTEHAHPLLPLIWSSGEKVWTQSRPVELGVLAAGGENPVALPLAGLYGLVLRYGGVHDVTFRLRSSETAQWTDLLVSYSMVSDGSALGPALGACQDALRAILGNVTVGRDGTEALLPRAAAAENGGRSYGVTVRAAGGDSDASARDDADDDAVVFLLRHDALSQWSVSLRTAFTPADPGAPARVLAHLAAFIRTGVASPQTRVGETGYLSAAERQLIEEVNDPPRVRSGARSIHGLVEEAARRHPGSTAVIQGTERISFRYLDQKANAVAAAVMARGVSRGDRVGILATRSIEFVVAALAVLKAGAAYVPLDPLLPAARLSTLFQIGSVRLLLAEHTVQEVASGLTEAWMAIPPIGAIKALPGAQLRAPATRGEDLAYIIFTSGSSGTPKGVLLDHYGRVNLLVDLNERLAIGPGDCTLIVASPSFDTSVLEIFGSLAAGAAIVLPERGREYDVPHWVELARAEGVTVWNSVPSSLTVFLRAWEQATQVKGSTPGPGALRAFLLGGDWIPLEQPARIWAAFPDAEIFAIGGNTEVSVCTTMYAVTEVPAGRRSIPYGRALTNQTVYVLDPFGELAPPDLAGELAFGGVGVGWGYDAHPRLTADRFVPDPFGPVPGGRLYRTGDRGRLRPDGFIELLGRLDQQIKIEGVRIELGEIQACLCRQPEVAEGAVVPRRATDGQVHSLVACAVPTSAAARGVTVMTGNTDHDAATPLATVLRERMAAELPRLMVPQRVLILDSLPLNSNGKVDQRSLEALAAADAPPQPGDKRWSRPEEADEIVRGVAEVWADVLGLDALPHPVAVFADLGGGSLAAMQVASRLSTRFNADIKVADLFTTATLTEVAKLVRASRRTSRPMPALARRRRG